MVRYSLSLIVLLASVSFATTTMYEGYVRGYVLNEYGSVVLAGVSGATLTGVPGYDTGSGITASDGYFYFSLSGSGTQQVNITKTGYDNSLPLLQPAGGYINNDTIKVSQTINFNLPTSTYGDAPFTLIPKTSTILGDGLPITYWSLNTTLHKDTVVTISGDIVTIHKAGIDTIRGTQNGNKFYGSTQMVDHILSVQPKTLTITADNKTKTINTIDPTLTVSCSGFISGESASNLSGTLVLIRAAGEIAGSYAITPSGLTSTNYNITYVPGTLTITKKSQTIAFSSIDPKTYGYDVSFNLSATASSGLPVTFSSSNPLIATVSGNMVTIVGAGLDTITASQAGDPTHDVAPNVGRALSISRGFQILNPLGITGAMSYGDVFNLTATSSAGLAVSYTSSIGSVATVSGNIVTCVGLGSTDIHATQPGNTNYNPALDSTRTLTVQARVLTVTLTVVNKVYDGNTSATVSAGILNGVVGSDNVILTASGVFADATVGNAKPVIVTLALSGTKAGNYSIVSPVTLTANITAISKTNQTISFNFPDSIKVYGSENFTLSATASSALPVSFSSSDTSVAKVFGDTVKIIGGGMTTITASQGGSSIYNPAPGVQRTLTVTKAGAMVTMGNLTASYDGSPKSVSAATNPSGLSVLVTYNGSPVVPINVGSYAAVATIADKNYQGSTFDTFRIVDDTPPTVVILSPKTNDVWLVSSTHDIKWLASDNVGVTSRAISFSADSGKTWVMVDSASNNSGTMAWILPGNVTDKAFLRIKVYDAQGNSSVSDVGFYVAGKTRVLVGTGIKILSYDVVVYDLSGRIIQKMTTQNLQYIFKTPSPSSQNLQYIFKTPSPSCTVIKATRDGRMLMKKTLLVH